MTRYDPNEWDHAACRLWPLVVAAASKGKLVSPAEAERLLSHVDLDAVEKACAALQRWCWLRGLPPLDRVVSYARARDPVRPVADYEVFFEAMGVDVTTERFVLAYPWRKVMEPSPSDVAAARVWVEGMEPALRAFRFVDLELDLREADAAKGRRRPAPQGFSSWDAAAGRHRDLLGQFDAAGLHLRDLRPPGTASYPPPRPQDNRAHL